MGAACSWEGTERVDALRRELWWLRPRRRHGRRRRALGLDGNDDYAAQLSKGREGDEGGAHGGSDERLGGLGGGLEATGDNGDLRRPCREEELDDEASGRPGSCGSA